MFNGGPLLLEPMQASIWQEAPQARFVRLAVPPVVGAALLGMEQGGLSIRRLRPRVVDAARAVFEKQAV
jgi:hypothetical protein